MTKKKETKKVESGLIFSWIFGILFLLSAIGYIFSGEFFSGIVLFVMAGTILPTVNKILKEKQDIELSRGLKITIIVIGLIIIGIVSNSSNIDTTSNYNNTLQETSQNSKVNSCISEWSCGNWSECSEFSKQTRTCLDKNSCGISLGKPQTSQPCKYIIAETKTSSVRGQSDKATIGEKNALKEALSYLDTMAFSYKELIKQLEYVGYTRQEATYGVDNSGANWNEQAKLKAQSYLDTMAFSKDGLIKQLEYDGFTREQAEDGVQAVGY